MSAELCSERNPSRDHGGLQETTVGGSKPLHRFLKGQPKTIGTVVLVLGISLFIATIACIKELPNRLVWATIPPTVLQGAMFIAAGILYILTEHNTTKKTVTISLALSILCILADVWTTLRILLEIGHYSSFRRYDVYYDDNVNATIEIDLPESTHHIEGMLIAFETVAVLHSFAGAIICIVMSALAVAALRSTKSQAIVIMTMQPTENEENIEESANVSLGGY